MQTTVLPSGHSEATSQISIRPLLNGDARLPAPLDKLMWSTSFEQQQKKESEAITFKRKAGLQDFRSSGRGANLIGRWRRQFEEEASGVRLSGLKSSKEVRHMELREVKYDFIGTHARFSEAAVPAAWRSAQRLLCSRSPGPKLLAQHAVAEQRSPAAPSDHKLVRDSEG